MFLYLAVPQATDECPSRNFNILMRGTGKWFPHSYARHAKAKGLCCLINDSLTLLKLSQTRWMSVGGAGVGVSQQLSELKTHFEID